MLPCHLACAKDAAALLVIVEKFQYNNIEFEYGTAGDDDMARVVGIGFQDFSKIQKEKAVSYNHLTLPKTTYL